MTWASLVVVTGIDRQLPWQAVIDAHNVLLLFVCTMEAGYKARAMAADPYRYSLTPLSIQDGGCAG